MAATDNVIKTPLGPVRGYTFETQRGFSINAYEGIPYAKPPLGELRFKPPVPIEPWSEVLDATKAPPKAASVIEFILDKNVFLPDSSEDCLYLNVFTPANVTSTSKLPVMVFIHGGAFRSGSGNRSMHGPDYLVPKGIILVNVNYRLGPFGFLSLKTPKYSGNCGLKDQTLALRWVKDNIDAFGGDASNVTIFGVSAGAASVQYHTLSPLSKGLFHRAVALSGSVLTRWAYSKYPKELAVSLAKKLGASSDDPEEVISVLLKSSTQDILFNVRGIYHQIEGTDWYPDHLMDTIPFLPTTEPEDAIDAFITKHPEQALLDGDSADVPFMTGICANECIFYIPSPDYVPDIENTKILQKILPKELGLPLDSPKVKEAAMKLKNFYFPNGGTQSGFIRSLTAYYYAYGIFKTIQTLARDPKKSTPNYLYVFEPTNVKSFIKTICNLNSVPGICHGDDIRFYTFMADPMYKPEPIDPGSNEEIIMETFTSLLTEFAQSGKFAKWPISDVSNSWSYIHFGETIKIKEGFLTEEMKLWEEIYDIMKN